MLRAAYLTDLANKLRKSPAIQQQDKVVFLMAGAFDILCNIDCYHIEERITDILDIILYADSTAVILIGQIPLLGLSEQAEKPFLEPTVAYNALLAEITNYYVTKKLDSVRLVHTSATQMDHTRHLSLLNPDGYRLIDHDSAEAIVYPAALRLIKGTFFSITCPKKRSLGLALRDDGTAKEVIQVHRL